MACVTHISHCSSALQMSSALQPWTYSISLDSSAMRLVQCLEGMEHRCVGIGALLRSWSRAAAWHVLSPHRWRVFSISDGVGWDLETSLSPERSRRATCARLVHSACNGVAQKTFPSQFRLGGGLILECARLLTVHATARPKSTVYHNINIYTKPKPQEKKTNNSKLLHQRRTTCKTDASPRFPRGHRLIWRQAPGHVLQDDRHSLLSWHSRSRLSPDRPPKQQLKRISGCMQALLFPSPLSSLFSSLLFYPLSSGTEDPTMEMNTLLPIIVEVEHPLLLEHLAWSVWASSTWALPSTSMRKFKHRGRHVKTCGCGSWHQDTDRLTYLLGGWGSRWVMTHCTSSRSSAGTPSCCMQWKVKMSSPQKGHPRRHLRIFVFPRCKPWRLKLRNKTNNQNIKRIE